MNNNNNKSDPKKSERLDGKEEEKRGLLNGLIHFCLKNKIVVFLFLLLVVGVGLIVSPFGWNIPGVQKRPVPVDAIPNIGENQQIVFTRWKGRSPQDVEDQITYPLTTALLGIPGVKAIRSKSMLGFSSIYVIFKEDIEFYWSRTRILEKLNSLPAGTLPQGVQPQLGPDATALGQIYWYTLEGRDRNGNPTGGWDLHELRSIQDWFVRYSLMSTEGVAEVASVGGYVQEYQIDVDPNSLRAYDVTLNDVFSAVRKSNIDVGARTIEINQVEYVIRGLGFIENLQDIKNTVVATRNDYPVRIKDLGHVTTGPALRRGALDKSGSEAVGGVVTVRYGDNPMKVIQNLKNKIEEISPGLPQKVLVEDSADLKQVRNWAEERGVEGDGSSPISSERFFEWRKNHKKEPLPGWITISSVEIVPFYDRTELIQETLGTLETALTEEILVAIIVVLLIVFHFRSSVLISGLLPLSVLLTFIVMKVYGMPANIVSLSGIAIAIGVMVDMGIVVCENILKHLDQAGPDENRLEVVYRGTAEVSHAVLTAVAMMVISFLPIFTMEQAEGKLFKPLAFTKITASIAAIVVAIVVIPPLAHLWFSRNISSETGKKLLGSLFVVGGILIGSMFFWWLGLIVGLIGLYYLFNHILPEKARDFLTKSSSVITALLVAYILARHWSPLGPEKGLLNVLFVVMLIGGLLGAFMLLLYFYEPLIRISLQFKGTVTIIALLLTIWGGVIWLGFSTVFEFVPASLSAVGIKEESIRTSGIWKRMTTRFPGLGKEFMPPLDEGSFLYMPTTSPHASIGEALDGVQKQDMAIEAIPEVTSVVGKIGRVDSPLDPAPVSMVETIVNYKTEYKTNEKGHILRFRYNEQKQKFDRDEDGNLIRDPDGRPFRQWRDHIQSPDDIWKEIRKAAKLPGWTDAPKLQPIKNRVIMLQTGMKAPLGVKVYGPDLQTVEDLAIEIEKYLKEVPGIDPLTVSADRLTGKPYLEIDLNRENLARHGISVKRAQNIIEVAIGGKHITTTVEGRERYPVRVRYKRELRNRIDDLEQILVPSANGAQIPLGQIAEVKYERGAKVIKSEDTFNVAYVTFDKEDNVTEVEAVEQAKRYLTQKQEEGEFVVPGGVKYVFAGNYKNQQRAQKRLYLILPITLLIVFLVIYFHFNSLSTSFIVFSGVGIAWAGGFFLIWFYGQDWFLDFTLFERNMRDLFQIQSINLTVAVWVGFLALFGIANENGVVMATYLKQIFAKRDTDTIQGIREATVRAGLKRIRPCLMTTATTILALIPVLTSAGRGSDVMVPMAIPSVGGMAVVLLTVVLVPVLYGAVEEFKQHTGWSSKKVDILVLSTLGLGLLVPVFYCSWYELSGKSPDISSLTDSNGNKADEQDTESKKTDEKEVDEGNENEEDPDT